MDLREPGHGFQEIQGASFENQCRGLSCHAEKETEPASKHCGIKTLNNGHVKRSVTKTATLHIKPSDQLLNTLGTGYLNCLYAYKRKSASPVLNVLTSFLLTISL
jgi:hypothetical protein